MLGFIVPIKPKKHSTNWDSDNLLLERTIRSICRQTSGYFIAVIVYSDLPEVNFSDNNVHFVHYPYGDIAISEIDDWEDRKKWYTPAYAERMMDKGRKIMLGCKLAKELGCTYLMAVDSDDLVSERLAKFVLENANRSSAGWRFSKGYMYEEGSKIVVKNHQIWGINGSTHIIRTSLVVVPDLKTNYNLFDYSLFEGHAYTMQRLIDHYKETLESLPFFGVIYIIHNNNHSKVKEIVSTITIKHIIKKLVFGKFVNDKIRKEFGLYNII